MRHRDLHSIGMGIRAIAGLGPPAMKKKSLRAQFAANEHQHAELLPPSGGLILYQPLNCPAPLTKARICGCMANGPCVKPLPTPVTSMTMPPFAWISIASTLVDCSFVLP